MSAFSDKKFYWGSATSSHQVEGNTHNDWTEWEKATAADKIKSAKSKEWPDFILQSYPSPLQKENYISGRACDHYNRFRGDFDIAKSLGHNAHRFSIEWSRIEPEEGKFDEKEIEHYREVIRALRERGMEPFITLWHWTSPLWFVEKGGWESRDAVKNFVIFSKSIAEKFKNDVRFWMPLNEPALWVSMAYTRGIFPPGKKNIFRSMHVYNTLLAAHRETYKALKKINRDFQIGTAENMSWIDNAFLRFFTNYFRDFYFLRKAYHEIDFVGLNYYSKKFGKKTKQVSDRGWQIYPEGFYKQLKLLHQFKKPIFVTENGIADAKDIMRGEFIREHVRALMRARDEGVDIRGYFYWSLLDNFEWEEGFWPRFGLIEIDYKTQERKVRKSAYAYAELIKEYS